VALPHDPDLEPVPAAKAAMAAAARVTPTVAPTASSPVIRPVHPDRWERTVPLDHPLFVDESRIDGLRLRMLTGADIARLVMEEDDDHSLNVRARALVAGVHPALFEALSGPDFERVADAIRPFLPPSLVAADDRATEALLDGVLSPAD
jgi:Phage tail assembly chaperone proteins, E, or 41 or 14